MPIDLLHRWPWARQITVIPIDEGVRDVRPALRMIGRESPPNPLLARVFSPAAWHADWSASSGSESVPEAPRLKPRRIRAVSGARFYGTFGPVTGDRLPSAACVHYVNEIRPPPTRLKPFSPAIGASPRLRIREISRMGILEREAIATHTHRAHRYAAVNIFPLCIGRTAARHITPDRKGKYERIKFDFLGYTF